MNRVTYVYIVNNPDHSSIARVRSSSYVRQTIYLLLSQFVASHMSFGVSTPHLLGFARAVMRRPSSGLWLEMLPRE